MSFINQSSQSQQLIRLLSVVLLCFSFVSTGTNASELHAAAWQSFKSGKAIIIMRHALAPGTGDPTQFELRDCSTQRNLSNEGREQSVLIGNIIRQQGVDQASVYTSQWCRCIDTAALLGLGEPEELPMLNSFFRDRSTEPEQTRSLRDILGKWLSEAGGPRILVTHQVNISALTGEFARSGEMLFITMEDEEVKVLASFLN